MTKERKHPKTVEALVRDYGYLVERYREALGESYDDFVQTIWLDAVRKPKGDDSPCAELRESRLFATYNPLRMSWNVYFKRYLKWAYLDWKRDRTERNREVEDADQYDIEDPASLTPHDTFISDDYMQALFAHLDHQFAGQVGAGVLPLYFELNAEGLTDSQILADELLPLTRYNSPTGWNNFKKQWLYPAVEDFLRKNPPV